MRYSIKLQPTFVKEAKRLGKRYPSITSDIQNIGKDLLKNPEIGVDLGCGLRKIRMRITPKGRGKSGGARVITFNVVAAIDETVINLIYIYDKADRSNISTNEIEQLLKNNGLNK